jgi:serine protease DegS
VSAVLLFVLVMTMPGNGADTAARELGVFAGRLSPAVVHIKGYMRGADEKAGLTLHNQGSGFLFDERGYLFSVYSVFTDPQDRILCEKFEVMLSDGRVIPARAFVVDPLINLAILKLTETGEYPVIDISPRPIVRAGDRVVALAGATSDEETVFSGLVKAENRTSLYGAGLADLLIDTHMTLPAYAYGGPLVNEKGEVVGVNMPGMHRDPRQDAVENEEHALPLVVVRTVYQVSMAYPTFEQPWLGLAARRQTASGAGRGLVVEFVWTGGPADRAGLQVGDILLSANGEALEAVYELDRLLLGAKPDAQAEFEVSREGRSFTRKIKVEKRPSWAAP